MKTITVTSHCSDLLLAISPKTVLVDLSTVRAAWGLDADTVRQRVEDGHLRWVFDVGPKPSDGDGVPGKRELRFWIRELVSPRDCESLNLEQALLRILGASPAIRRGELERQWVVSHVTVHRWIRQREIYTYGTGLIARDSLADFLRSRHASAYAKERRHLEESAKTAGLAPA
jgi:hypothetical protein